MATYCLIFNDGFVGHHRTGDIVIRFIFIMLFSLISVNYISDANCKDYAFLQKLNYRVVDGECQVNIGKYDQQVWQNKDRHEIMQLVKTKSIDRLKR